MSVFFFVSSSRFPPFFYFTIFLLIPLSWKEGDKKLFSFLFLFFPPLPPYTQLIVLTDRQYDPGLRMCCTVHVSQEWIVDYEIVIPSTNASVLSYPGLSYPIHISSANAKRELSSQLPAS